MKRKANKGTGSENSDTSDGVVPVPIAQDQKTFEGGFFLISSPSRKATPQKNRTSIRLG